MRLLTATSVLQGVAWKVFAALGVNAWRYQQSYYVLHEPDGGKVHHSSIPQFHSPDISINIRHIGTHLCSKPVVGELRQTNFKLSKMQNDVKQMASMKALSGTSLQIASVPAVAGWKGHFWLDDG